MSHKTQYCIIIRNLFNITIKYLLKAELIPKYYLHADIGTLYIEYFFITNYVIS